MLEHVSLTIVGDGVCKRPLPFLVARLRRSLTFVIMLSSLLVTLA